MVKVATEDSAGSFPVPARTQLLAVAWLRWRLFTNAFRRRAGRGQVTGLVFSILLRILSYGIFAAMGTGAVLGAGVVAFTEATAHREQNLALLLAGIFVGWQFVSLNGLNIAANTPSFDPSSLVRFPLPFRRYLILRTLFGLLTPSTVFGCVTLLAVAAGITIADHTLAVPAFLVAALYAWLNIFFTRMIAVWLDRWLASRRFREIFGALMALVFVSIQVVNLADRPSNSSKDFWLAKLPHGSAPFLRWLPPGLAVGSLHFASNPVVAIAQFFGLLAWTALFLAIFAIRIHKQFLGEYLSEATPRMPTSAARPRRSSPASAAPRISSSAGVVSPVVWACLRKEWLELRSSGGQLLAMTAPLVFVFILGKGVFAADPGFFLPGAIAYVMLGVVPRLYNIFGADGCGVQVYLLAPLRLRDVIVAKNIISLAPIVAEALLAWLIVIFLSKSPIPISTQISTAFWLLFVIAANVSVGGLRSIQEPHKFVPGQTRQARAPTGRTSALLAIAMVLGSLFVYLPVEIVCRYFGRPWLAVFLFAAFAAAGVAGCALLLRRADQFILRNRDRLAEELCRV